MVHLFVPPSLRRLESHLSEDERVTPHLCFCYDLTEAIRPALVVDLGAGDCASFFGFCRALVDHDVDGFCYAVDMWGKEPPEQAYSPAMERMMMMARKHFLGVSAFVRARPHEALRHFETGSIDLLRLDGSRPALFPAGDVAAWAERVRPGGWVLVAGTSDRGGSDIVRSLPGGAGGFSFYHGHGLTAVRMPGGTGTPAAQLPALLCDPAEHAELRRFYIHAQDHLELSQTVPWQNYGPFRPNAGKKAK